MWRTIYLWRTNYVEITSFVLEDVGINEMSVTLKITGISSNWKLKDLYNISKIVPEKCALRRWILKFLNTRPDDRENTARSTMYTARNSSVIHATQIAWLKAFAFRARKEGRSMRERSSIRSIRIIERYNKVSLDRSASMAAIVEFFPSGMQKDSGERVAIRNNRRRRRAET